MISLRVAQADCVKKHFGEKMKRAEMKDLEVGKWVWIEYYCGESGISCAGRVDSITTEIVRVKLFGTDNWEYKRGRIVEATVKSICKEETGIFIVPFLKIEQHLLKEKLWAKTEIEFLSNYCLEMNND